MQETASYNQKIVAFWKSVHKRTDFIILYVKWLFLTDVFYVAKALINLIKCAFRSKVVRIEGNLHCIGKLFDGGIHS